MRYSIGICEDDSILAQNLGMMIYSFFDSINTDCDVKTWDNGKKCIEALKARTDILNILFLDIELPGANGVEVGEFIRNTLNDEGMHIVFISSQTKYALELFKIHPFDFLIKPFTSEAVCNCISKTLMLDKQDRRFISFSDHGQIRKEPLGNILFLESIRKHIRIHLIGGETVEYPGKLSSEETKLSGSFVRISKSFIISLKHVTSCRFDYVVIAQKYRLNIGRPYRASFRERMKTYGISGGVMDE